MVDLDLFNSDLAELLDRHKVAIIAKSNKDHEDSTIEIGFQFGIHNKWYGRHHITANDVIKDKQ
ncbi:hypothetical protein VPHK121_0089 [Vibrio phage K121]